MILGSLGGLTGGGGEPVTQGTLSSKSSPSDKTADLRDSILALVGNGYTSLSDDRAKAHYSAIVNNIGEKNARNLLTHIFIQNNRPEFKGTNPQNRVQMFYDIGSSNPTVSPFLQQTKAFGYGPSAGLNDSVNLDNMKLAGKYIPQQTNNTDKAAQDAIKKSVMLKIAKTK